VPDSSGNCFQFPAIVDSDIDWVESLLSVDRFGDARRAFLKADQTLDVEACPGSGKTTLVVAKLAILARKWSYKDRGICVLSHTNVAREEIQERLGNHPVGQKLLSYPHFIGTIHSFANQFLALPWLRSNGYSITAIDDDVCEQKRQGLLGANRGVRYALQQNRIELRNVRITSKNFGISVRFRETTPTYTTLQNVCKQSAKEGFFYYDELFVWADALLEDCPEITEAIQARFPIVFVDEVQDTQEMQSLLLSKVFPRSCGSVVVQRVGDSNQAIFSSPSAEDGATTDPFPDSSRIIGIANSFRFGAKIGSLANPYSVLSVGDDGLIGVGPMVWPSGQEMKHTIFLFDDDNIEGVLPSFGKLLLASFTDEQINHRKFKAMAIGAVKKEPEEDIVPGSDKFPKSLCHYWNGFVPQMSKRDPMPKYMVNFIRVAQSKAKDAGSTSVAVEKIADGIIHLASYMGDIGGMKNRTYRHRAVLERLRDNQESKEIYTSLIRRLAISREDIEADIWEETSQLIKTIAQKLCMEYSESQRVNEFLSWQSAEGSLVDEMSTSRKAINTYEVTNDSRSVNIELDTIHNVKGQTHTATLVLETFNFKHDFEHLLGWVVGNKRNGAGAGKRQLKTLKLMFVGMTRPTHLLCLAMRKRALGEGDAFEENKAKLKSFGWHVEETHGIVAD